MNDIDNTFAAVSACAIAILAGAVLQASDVTAGKDKVIDWREVKSGEIVQEEPNAFDTARHFVMLVGTEAALAAAAQDQDLRAIRDAEAAVS